MSLSPNFGLYRSKLLQASEIMQEIGLDAWLIFVRETALNPDPITDLLWDFAVVWPAAFVITADGPRIATGVSHDAPTLEASSLFSEVVPFAKVPEETLPAIIARLDPHSIALNYSEEEVSSDGLSLGLYRRLQSMLADTPYPARFTSAEQLIGHLRQRKLPAELALMQKAVDTAGELFDRFTATVGIGMTETEMARIFLDEVQQRGITTSWDAGHCPNLNAGPKTGRGHVGPLPHVTLEPGHVMNVDFGVVVEGYASDQQRLWYALREGETDAPATVKGHFYAVRDAIRAAFAALKPGALGWQVDDAARSFITGAGYPEYMHAVGHNVGRYCHDGGVTILGPRWPSYGRRAFGPVEPGMVVTLNFKEGYTWHDGEPVTSADFAFTWQFIMDPATAAQTTAGWNKIASVETPDATTAIVTLEEPYVPFVPTTLTFPILPKHALEGVADPGSSEYARAPIGNGPFRFVEWTPGDRLVVEANPDAPTPPKLDQIIFKFVPDLNSMVALVRTGDIDVAWDYRETQIPELEKMEGVEAVLVPGLAIERYYFNLRNPEDLAEPHPILSDINVRKAIAMGMDRFTAVDGVLQGYGQVAVTELDNSPWFNEALEPVPYDPEAAAQMLEEAGWVDEDRDGIREKDGVRLSLRHSTTSGNQVRENLQVLFQQNLADIGVELVIDNYPAATLFGGCADGGVFGTSDFDMMGFTNQPVSIDLAQEWSDFFLSSSIKDCETNPAGTNSWGYSSDAADAALSCAVNELDPDARLECIMEAQQILYDDMIALYVYDRVDVYSVSDRVQGVQPTVFGGHSWNYADWSVTE